MGERILDRFGIGENPGRTRPIGGFFGLSLEEVPTVVGSVWDEWVAGSAAVLSFGSGRNALAAAVAAVRPRRVWLPAYWCLDAALATQDSAKQGNAEVRTYPLTDALDPDLRVLTAELMPQDLVIVVAYFGWSPSRSFQDWAISRSDVTWIEDRAHCLWTANPPWTPWQVFSPRKLIGVPNGGLLCAPEGHGPISELCGPANLAVLAPEIMRFEDIEETRNEYWYALYQERERSLCKQLGPMSRLTFSLLRRIPLSPLVSARQRNYDYFREHLAELAAWPRPATGVAPFGFIIAVEDAGALAHKLSERRLFCARHWAAIASDPDLFAYEHSLSRRLLTLPCDHRYSPADLARLVDAVHQVAPAPANILRS